MILRVGLVLELPRCLRQRSRKDGPHAMPNVGAEDPLSLDCGMGSGNTKRCASGKL